MVLCYGAASYSAALVGDVGELFAPVAEGFGLL